MSKSALGSFSKLPKSTGLKNEGQNHATETKGEQHVVVENGLD